MNIHSIKGCVISVAALIITLNTHAASITNGDFATGDFFGWSTNTDGFVGSLNDFAVIDESARISVDYWSTPGDDSSTALNDTFFASTLYQELDLTVNDGEQLILSFDWIFSSESAGSNTGDYFLVGLNDGTGSYFGADGALGFLLDPTTAIGSDSFSATLDFDTFANASGWFLDFQVNIGVDGSATDAFGSTLSIDSVSLQAVDAVVIPEPSSLVMFSLCLAGLLGVRSRI